MPHNGNDDQNELGRSGAGRTLSYCDASHAANSDAKDSNPASLEDELVLEEQRRAALKRLLTQPEYPSRTNLAIYGPDNARLGSSTSMGPAAIHNSQQPIDRLPNEILGAIFLVCGDPSPASAFPRDGTMHQLPMDPHQVVPIDEGERMISNVMRQDAVGGMSYASPPLSPHDISPNARDAPADVGSASSATGDLELALEEQRREALKRVLTRPEYPAQKAGSKSAKALIHSDSNSMTRRQVHNSQLPINRLPNELLCAIFFVCGDPSPASAFPRDPTMHDSHINPLNLKSYSRNVVLLGLVCSRWYHVTHGFPALWTIVDVEYPARYATNILKRCLAHSAGLPLTLWISESVNPRFYTDDEDPDPRFMILVAANAHRWKEMSIELYDKSDVLAPLIALPPRAFGILYRARVNFFRRGADATSPDTRLWKSWLTSPKLNTVDWVKIEHIRSGLAVAPLRQLTSIGLHVAEPAMLASVLNSCVNLELLHVDINPYRLGMKNIPPLTLASPICLPHLRTMMICGPND
ncbi:hypothetical protein EV121DRAFT_293592 [Schizophyllum commune]